MDINKLAVSEDKLKEQAYQGKDPEFATQVEIKVEDLQQDDVNQDKSHKRQVTMGQVVGFDDKDKIINDINELCETLELQDDQPKPNIMGPSFSGVDHFKLEVGQQKTHEQLFMEALGPDVSSIIYDKS